MNSNNKSFTAMVEDVAPEDLHVLRETHKYIFYGPMRKDLKNTYFGAVYLFEKKLRIQAGQKVVLAHGSKEVYGVALVGQAQNRQVWVWLVSFQTEDVVKRLIVQVQDIVGTQSPDERDICRNALARYQRRSRSYAAFLQQQAQLNSGNDSNLSDASPSSPLPKRLNSRRQTRSQKGSDIDSPERTRRQKRKIVPIEDDFESEAEDSFDLTESSSEDDEHPTSVISTKRLKLDRQLLIRKQTGDLFLTLLECVVSTLATEYPGLTEE